MKELVNSNNAEGVVVMDFVRILAVFAAIRCSLRQSGRIKPNQTKSNLLQRGPQIGSNQSVPDLREILDKPDGLAYVKRRC